MGRDIDETWIEKAVERYQRIDGLLAEFQESIKKVEVSVRSADGIVEVVVTAAGTITDVRISERATRQSSQVLAASVREAVTAAADAAAWARSRLYAEVFGDYQSLGREG